MFVKEIKAVMKPEEIEIIRKHAVSNDMSFDEALVDILDMGIFMMRWRGLMPQK